MLKLSGVFFLLFYAAPQVPEITGWVTYDNQRLNGVVVKNKSMHIHALSNERGEFVIKAGTGDTIITQAADFENDTLIVANQRDIVFRLHKNPTVLKQVTVASTRITPESAYEATKKDYKMIYFNGDESGIFLSGSLVNIDKLNNALGKKGNEARKLQHKLDTDYKSSVIDKRFIPVATRITGYKGKQLDDFIVQNRPSYEMVIKASDYDIIQYVKKKLSETVVHSAGGK